jgi:hypothetical protein
MRIRRPVGRRPVGRRPVGRRPIGPRQQPGPGPRPIGPRPIPRSGTIGPRPGLIPKPGIIGPRPRPDTSTQPGVRPGIQQTGIQQPGRIFANSNATPFIINPIRPGTQQPQQPGTQQPIKDLSNRDQLM